MEIYKGQELKQRWSGANTKKLQPQHPMIEQFLDQVELLYQKKGTVW